MPQDSYTRSKSYGLAPGTDLNLILLAKLHDLMLMQAYGSGGKKTPKNQLILPTILPEDGNKKKSRKASIEFWENQKDVGFDEKDFFGGEKEENDAIK